MNRHEGPIPTASRSEPLPNQGSPRPPWALSTLPSEFSLDHVNPTHVNDFLQALAHDSLSNDSGTEHISAKSDLVPPLARERKHKRRKQPPEDVGRPYGVVQTLLKYPLIFLIGSIMFVELLLYLGLRQTVRMWESTFSWRGKRRQLRSHLRASKTYEEWCAAAEALDRYMDKDDWKAKPAYGYYDYRLIQKVIKHLRKYRAADDEESAIRLQDVLYVCLKQNFAGVENAKLYSNTYLGTKYLIDEYVNEVTASLEALVDNRHISSDEKRLTLRLYAKNYGRSALCLSGGAGFGYFHLGPLRALLDRQLLPPIVTGTSAGSLLGALVCTRTNEELAQVLVPGLAQRIRIAQDSWYQKLKRYATTGALFDAEHWCREAMWFARGSMTFKEAYERTGRIYNVSVVPADPHSPQKTLNYITTPNCCIFSAILASAAIPGILNPVVLMQKIPNSSHLVPYNYGHRFKDGSLRTDIPTQALHNLFNVNYAIVSQVNPHIHIFFYANQGSPGRPVTHRYGKGWRGGFLASTAEQVLKLELSKWLKVLRDLDLLPKVMNQDWSSIWLQKFDGEVTILPKASLSDWRYLVADPDEKRIERLLESGQLQTWPKVAMIRNRLAIEKAISSGRRKLRDLATTEREPRRSSGATTTATTASTVQSPAPRTRLSGDDGGTSDEGATDDMFLVDEAHFLRGRRASMPGRMDDRELAKEEQRRRRFIAKFTANKAILDEQPVNEPPIALNEWASDDDDSDSDL
ncbi:acyl transferase/acyl hydrolase/lysophospholipase [Gongronella butleri]|nr:acyl transferase/acyl hydrolase/lysophospholipase [Gongronella butleri]